MILFAGLMAQESQASIRREMEREIEEFKKLASISQIPEIFSNTCMKQKDCITALGGISGWLTITTALAKEIQAVIPDAIQYSIDGSTTPALESVVVKIQEEALKQNIEISFEEIINDLSMSI